MGCLGSSSPSGRAVKEDLPYLTSWGFRCKFIFGVCSEAWEGTALGTEWVWSSDQVSFPPFKPPSKPNSSQFFAPKLTDLGDPVLSDRFPLHPLDLKLHFVLLLFIKNDYCYRFFFFFPISVIAKHNFKCLC